MTGEIMAVAALVAFATTPVLARSLARWKVRQTPDIEVVGAGETAERPDGVLDAEDQKIHASGGDRRR